MKNQERQVRNHFVKMRMNDEELREVIRLQQKTTEKTLSEYLRKVSLQKPVAITYRNAAADRFLEEMSGLRKELSAFGNNYNQAVKKLHTLDKIPEFRNWAEENEKIKRAFLQKSEEIKSRIHQIHDQWSHA